MFSSMMHHVNATITRQTHSGLEFYSSKVKPLKLFVLIQKINMNSDFIHECTRTFDGEKRNTADTVNIL